MDFVEEANDCLWEELDMADEAMAERVLGEYDELLFKDSSRRCYQLVEASQLLDKLWANAWDAWRLNSKGRDLEESENVAKMQSEVLTQAFDEMFEESQKRVDQEINRPLYGYTSSDFDIHGELQDTKQISTGFSDEKVQRICDIYGHAAPGLRGAEQRMADIESLIVCLYLYIGSVFRKLGPFYEFRRRLARKLDFRITDMGVPHQQSTQENDVSQWCQFMQDATC